MGIIKNTLKKLANHGKQFLFFRMNSGPKQSYDALKGDPTREEPVIRTEATETEQMFTADKRVKSYAWSDNLYDNDSIGSTLEGIIRLTIGVKGGVPVFTGEGAIDAQTAFDEWKKTAGFYEDEHWQEMLALILRTVLLHGDCMIMLDKDFTDGKLRVWDSDQICNVNDSQFNRMAKENGWFDGESFNEKTRWRQVEGVVMNTEGRVQGYFVTSLRNRYAVEADTATFIPARLARRVSFHRKITQYRGESVFLPNCEVTSDTKDLVKSAVSAAKLLAEHTLVHKRPSSFIAGALEGMTDSQITDGTPISEEQVAALKAKVSGTNEFKALAGKAAIAEISNDEELTSLDNGNHPAPAIREWMDKMDDANGKRLGVMSCLARGRADNSYSSGQIEVTISWSSFEEYQKLLERKVVDYVCGILFPNVQYTVVWPKAFEIDPQKAEATKDARLRGGRSTFEEELGPHWKEKLQQLANEKKYLESIGLDNLSFFQTVSGGNASNTNSENNDGETEQWQK